VLLSSEKGLGVAFRAAEVELPGMLVESTVRAAAHFAAGKALAIGAVSARTASLIEEVLKTMFLTKLKLASAVTLLTGAAVVANVLAQTGARPDARPKANQPYNKPAPAGSRRASGVDSAPALIPAYITQSRTMIITRLEEEVAEARTRLERTLRKVQSPDDPAVLHARKTLEALEQRLDRIDQVLVDVVETYPTMVDFSRGPSDSASSSQSAAGSIPKPGNAGDRLDVEWSNDPELARAKDRVDWAKRMFDKGYVSRSLWQNEVKMFEDALFRSRARQFQRGSQKGGDNSQPSNLRQEKPGQSQNQEHRGQGKTSNEQPGQSQQQGQPGEGQPNNAQQGQSPDQGQGGKAQPSKAQQEQSQNSGLRGQTQPNNAPQGQSPDQGERGQGKANNAPQGQNPDQEQPGQQQSNSPKVGQS
jgi:hypothetical protein